MTKIVWPVEKPPRKDHKKFFWRIQIIFITFKKKNYKILSEYLHKLLKPNLEPRRWCIYPQNWYDNWCVLDPWRTVVFQCFFFFLLPDKPVGTFISFDIFLALSAFKALWRNKIFESIPGFKTFVPSLEVSSFSSSLGYSVPYIKGLLLLDTFFFSLLFSYQRCSTLEQPKGCNV